jgi:transcriptional regulator GlxA family with amidase domain
LVARLVQTGVSLKTLARESGFRNADHFCKVSGRDEGTPVKLYRKKRQQVFQRQGAASG